MAASRASDKDHSIDLRMLCVHHPVNIQTGKKKSAKPLQRDVQHEMPLETFHLFFISLCGLTTNEAPTSQLLERACDCYICFPPRSTGSILSCSAGPLASTFPAVRPRTLETFARPCILLKCCYVSILYRHQRICHFSTFTDKTGPPAFIIFFNIINTKVAALLSSNSSGSLAADLWPSTPTA